jgi:hypothetical protein
MTVDEVAVDYTYVACDGTVFGMMSWKIPARRDHRLL